MGLNQDALLERLWVEVINAVDGVALPDAPLVEPKDAQQVARLVRYEALFGWCAAFDEAGHTVAWWLKKPVEHAPWLRLSNWSEESVAELPTPIPGEPFSDAEEAFVRLSNAKVSGASLAAWMTGQSRLALERLREILASQKWRSGELSGMHEELLSADPSGLEGRPGSWPIAAAQVQPPAQGPRLILKKSHALAFSPDGARIVAAKGGAITELASGRVVAKCAVLPHTSHVTWSPGGRWIAATSTSGAIAVCDANTGARVTVLSQGGEGVAPQFENDRELVAADWGGAVTRWDVEQGRLLTRVRLSVAMLTGLERAADGRWVLLVRVESGAMKCVRLEADLLSQLGTLPLPSWVEDLALDGSGKRALLTGGEHAAWLDLDTGELSGHFDARDPIIGGAVSGDGRWVALTSLIKGSFWVGPSDDLSAGRERALQFANLATFSPDSRQIALATWNEAEIWEVEALLGSGT